MFNVEFPFSYVFTYSYTILLTPLLVSHLLAHLWLFSGTAAFSSHQLKLKYQQLTVHVMMTLGNNKTLQTNQMNSENYFIGSNT